MFSNVHAYQQRSVLLRGIECPIWHRLNGGPFRHQRGVSPQPITIKLNLPPQPISIKIKLSPYCHILNRYNLCIITTNWMKPFYLLLVVTYLKLCVSLKLWRCFHLNPNQCCFKVQMPTFSVDSCTTSGTLHSPSSAWIVIRAVVGENTEFSIVRPREPAWFIHRVQSSSTHNLLWIPHMYSKIGWFSFSVKLLIWTSLLIQLGRTRYYSCQNG